MCQKSWKVFNRFYYFIFFMEINVSVLLACPCRFRNKTFLQIYIVGSRYDPYFSYRPCRKWGDKRGVKFHSMVVDTQWMGDIKGAIHVWKACVYLSNYTSFCLTVGAVPLILQICRSRCVQMCVVQGQIMSTIDYNAIDCII